MLWFRQTLSKRQVRAPGCPYLLFSPHLRPAGSFQYEPWVMVDGCAEVLCRVLDTAASAALEVPVQLNVEY